MTQNATICVGTLGQGIWRSSDGGSAVREIRMLRSTWRGLETWHGIGLNRRASPRPYLAAPGGEIPRRLARWWCASPASGCISGVPLITRARFSTCWSSARATLGRRCG